MVRCYSCGTFQAKQRTKSKKWNCKLCGSKQSLRKVYACSSKAADIRPIVMNLNMARSHQNLEDEADEDESNEQHQTVLLPEDQTEAKMGGNAGSKWDAYLVSWRSCRRELTYDIEG